MQIWDTIAALNHGLKEFPSPTYRLRNFTALNSDEFAHETSHAIALAGRAPNEQGFRKPIPNPRRCNTLPLRRSGNIVHGNACRIDWNTVYPHTPDEEVYIMGNPPYLGGKLQDADQKQDMISILGHFDSYKNLDYISCWFYLGAIYIQNSNAKCAFVSTNSITQGDQVALLWQNIRQMILKLPLLINLLNGVTMLNSMPALFVLCWYMYNKF